MELFQSLENWTNESSAMNTSQDSLVSDSFYVDNNPLLAACEANADISWKFSTDELVSGDEEFADTFSVGSFTEVVDEFGHLAEANNLAFSSSVALSPPNSVDARNTDEIENGGKIENNDVIVDTSKSFNELNADANEGDAIIRDIFGCSQQTDDIDEQSKIEEIKNWLLMNSTESNDCLEVKETEDSRTESVDDSVADNVCFGVEDALTVEIEVSVSSDVIDVSERSSASLRKKRSNENDDEYVPPAKRKTAATKSDKKRGQNKEAAKRYRERKKMEAENFKSETMEMEERIEKSKMELMDKLKERNVFLDLFKSLQQQKTNPNFSIIFPNWMS